MAKEKKIETKKDEIRFVTDDPKKMLNKYSVNSIKRTWKEDFLDEDTQEVVTIERNDLLYPAGTLIDQDVLVQIQFHQQAGELKEVEVSNQKRTGYEWKNTSLYPWKVKVEVVDVKKTLLVYASSIDNVMEIVKDYVELNYNGGFRIISAMEIDSCVILQDNYSEQKPDIDKMYLNDEITMEEYNQLKEEESEETGETKGKKFYQLEVKISVSDGVERTSTFVVHTTDTERAMMCISAWLKNNEKMLKEKAEADGRDYEIRSFKLCIEKAGPMPISEFVPKEFSLVYNEPEK